MVGAATSAITGRTCSPYGFHWAFDTRALAGGTGGALVKTGGDTWFFLTADYAFGRALEEDVTHAGGTVIGSVRVRLNSSDFSSFLLQAQSSKRRKSSVSPHLGQIDLPVCERNMPGKKTNLPEYEIIGPGCFRPGALLSHGRAQAVVITSGYRLHALSE